MLGGTSPLVVLVVALAAGFLGAFLATVFQRAAVFVAGFVAGMGDTDVRDFCTLTARTPCRVTVASR